MRFFALTSLALAATVYAQNQTVQVQVGGNATSSGGIFQFIPSTFNASAGSTITFEFSGTPGNHSITQSSFSDPCNPLAGGFDSGWVLIPTDGLSAAPTWTLTITNDTTPIWFYCKQLLPSPHCSAGMVGAINAPTTGNTFSAFQSNAQSFTGTPGQEVGALIGQGASASAPPVLVSGATLFGTPSATAPSGGVSSTASVSSTATTGTPSNSALGMQVNSVVALFAALVGITLS